jgi:hypothetical protein
LRPAINIIVNTATYRINRLMVLNSFIVPVVELILLLMF